MHNGEKDTPVVKVSHEEPDISAVREAVSALRAGAVIGMPTDTVYALAADAFNDNALRRLFEIKSREPDKPTSVIIHSASQLSLLTDGISRQAEILIEAFWPGPLTIIFRASDKASSLLTAGKGTIGARVPGNPVCLSVLREAGFPLTAPSANISGRPPAGSAQEVFKIFNRKIGLVLDGGEADSSVVSTIVQACGAGIKILREGKISANAIEKALGGKSHEA